MPELIEDDEVLFRRIPVSTGWVSGENVKPEAFGPTKYDDSGLSLFRKRFKSLEDAARGKSKHGYYVAELRVGDLKKVGIEIIFKPDVPTGYDEAHVELPQMTYAIRKETKILERQRVLADLCLIVHGPFVESESTEA